VAPAPTTQGSTNVWGSQMGIAVTANTKRFERLQQPAGMRSAISAFVRFALRFQSYSTPD
jgi:hypothetical protein